MMKFPIFRFENKRNFLVSLFAAFNGGKLLVTDSEYILKWLFFNVARFPKEETEIVPAPEGLLFQGLYFKCGKRIWELQFRPQIAEQLYGLYLNDLL